MLPTAPRLFFAALCLCAVLLPNSQAAPPNPGLTPQQIAAIDHFISAEMAREHIPGLAVGIYSRGQILLAKGYGLSNIELNVPVKPETIFQSGSVGKQFTSAAIMLLVEENKISLEDSLAKFFPGAPASWQAIKIKNLLSHTSGLAEYETDELTGPAGPFYLRLDFTEDQLAEKIAALPIEFPPGEKWDYRNTNYVLLGIIVHKITGKFYADFLQERIFQPLGMTATRLISEADIIPNRAAGYELHGDQLKNQSWVSPTFNSTADGALYFNVLDLAKWDAALYTTKLLKQSSLDQMWTVFPLNNGQPNPGNYGFAWAISRINGHKLIEHDGSWQGFRTQISRYVDDSLTVTVLANIDAARPDHIAQVVAGLADPALDPPKLTPIADNQPELLARLRALLELLASGADVRAQLTPELAKQLAESSPEAAANFASQLKQVWPANSITLVARKLEDGLTISAYRLTKNNETRIVRFALAPDGKIAHLSLHPDPDLR